MRIFTNLDHSGLHGGIRASFVMASRILIYKECLAVQKLQHSVAGCARQRRRTMRTVFVVIFLASSAFAQNPDRVPHAPPTCGPLNAEFQTKTDYSRSADVQPESGKALVYVVEDQKFHAAKEVTARIGLDGAWVGATHGESYIFFPVDPGEHHLCADWRSTLLSNGRRVSLFAFTAEAGKVYYFRARTMGGPSSMLDRSSLDESASLDLEPVNDDEGKLLVSNSPYSASHPKK